MALYWLPATTMYDELANFILQVANFRQGNVFIWRMYQNQDSTTLLPCRSFKAHTLYLTRLLISPDVKALATCSADHSVKIWKIDPAEEFLEEPPKEEPTNNGTSSATLNGSSADLGKKSMTGSTSFGRVIHPAPNGTGKVEASIQSSMVNSSVEDFPGERALPCETVLDGHQRWVWDCAFSADSAYLVSVSSDHYARLWELSTAQIIRQYSGHHRGAVCVALNDYSEPR
jgi:target of rapamycin complex subunit LST8